MCRAAWESPRDSKFTKDALADDPHRFYVIERFAETNLLKVSPSGMMGHRYFDLTGQFGIPAMADTPIDDIADLLAGKTYE